MCALTNFLSAVLFNLHNITFSNLGVMSRKRKRKSMNEVYRLNSELSVMPLDSSFRLILHIPEIAYIGCLRYKCWEGTLNKTGITKYTSAVELACCNKRLGGITMKRNVRKFFTQLHTYSSPC